MDLRQLRYFLALHEHRSFVRAADAMGISQPAFSRSIQGLEQELGCLLVDRGKKDLRPTPEGQVVLQHALTLVRGASNLTSEINRMTKLDAGELRFGCSPALAARLVPHALREFMQRYPRINAHFEVSSREQLSRSLGRDEIDFFVADIRYCDADPSVQTQPLRARPFVLFCRNGHPLLDKDSLSTNDLFDYPLVGSSLPADTRKVLANLSGKNNLNLRLECDHIPLLIELIGNSDNIGLAAQEALSASLSSRELVQLHLRNLPSGLDSLNERCGIVTRSGFRLSPAAKAMIDLLLELDQLGG